MRRVWRNGLRRAVSLLKVGLALLVMLATIQPAPAAAVDLVRTIQVYPTPTQLVLDPLNGQVFVVSVGLLTEVGANGGQAGLTLVDGYSGRVLHRWPNWPYVGANPLVGRIILPVGDHLEALRGTPLLSGFFLDGADVFGATESTLPLALLDPPTHHTLYLLHYSQPAPVDGFAVVDLPSNTIVHQQTLTGQSLQLIADDPRTGHFVLAGCGEQHVVYPSPPPPPCTLWTVDAHTGKVTGTTTTPSATSIDPMAIDARSSRLLLYDDVGPIGRQQQYHYQVQILSLYPFRLLHTIPLPHPYGAVAYGLLGQGAGIGVDEASNHALVLSSHSHDLAGSTDTAPGTARLLDTRSGQVLKTLAVGAQPATVVVDSALHRAYVADSMSCDISVVDMRAGRLVARVRTGKKFPVAELVDAITGKVFVINQYAGAITMFDAATTRMDPPGC